MLDYLAVGPDVFERRTQSLKYGHEALIPLILLVGSYQ